MNRDLIFLIALELDLVDLNNLCSSSKNVNNYICNSDSFWFYRLQKDFGFVAVNSKNAKDKYNIIVSKNYAPAVEKGYLDVVKWATYKSNNVYFIAELLLLSVKNNQNDITRYLVDLLKTKDTSDLYRELTRVTNVAILNNNPNNIVKSIVEAFPNINDYQTYMQKSAYKGNLELVKYFIEKGANNMNEGLWAAAEGDHKYLIDYFLSRGANDMNKGLQGSAAAGNMEMVKYFIDRGADNFGQALSFAAAFDRREIVDYLLSKPIEDWGIKTAASRARLEGHMDLYKYLLSKINK